MAGNEDDELISCLCHQFYDSFFMVLCFYEII